MTSLPKLEAERRRQCRLTADRALETLPEAASFLRDRGLLTRTPDSALPSLFGACHEPAPDPEARGFAAWPPTKWVWSFQLVSGRGALVTKLHRGKTLYLSLETARLFDPLCREAIAEARGDDAALLDHMAKHGDSLPGDLEFELGWTKARLRAARSRLERAGALVSEGLVFKTMEDWHLAPLRRWDAVFPKVVHARDPWADVVLAGVRAAVLAPEAEVKTWFSWPAPRGLVEKMVESGSLARPAPGWVSLPS
jgi:hypothetical protein